MKKFLPDIRGFETASLVLILIVEIIKYFVLTVLSFGMPNIFGLLILAFADAIRLFLETLSLALIVLMILSWVQPNSPVYQILNKFTSFITRPMHKVIPLIAGVDIVPMIAIIILQLIIIAIINPIIASGLAIATGA
jgi:YggT family protein